MSLSPHQPIPNPSFSVDSDGIGWLVFDDPDRRVNILTRDVLESFGQALEVARQRALEGKLAALVLWSGKESSFLAGADVKDIEGIRDSAQGEAGARMVQALFQELSDLPVPTLAAIHGTCLGGGLEMALASDVRVVSDAADTVLGFPEVLLGILPAFGGTTRTLELVGLRRALTLILSGKRVSAVEGSTLGIVHEVLPAGEFREKVEERARELAHEATPSSAGRTLLDRTLEASSLGRRLLVTMARRKVLRRTGGHYPAPLEILELVRKAWGRPTPEGLALEAEAVGRLLVTPESKNLIHLFRLREDARKGRGIPGEVLTLPRAPDLKRRPSDGPGLIVFRILEACLREAQTLEGEGRTRVAIDRAAREFGMAMGPFALWEGPSRPRKRRGKGDPGTEERLVLAMINEAARVLEEDRAPRAGTVDLALVAGGGFPAFRGGLLRYADQLGVGSVAARLRSLSESVGVRFTPSPLLAELASGSDTFYSRFP
jgi:enoyl-CoA hydratase/carnithine racemase